MIKIAHIVTGLAADGAERMLYNVVAGLDPSRFRCEVISLTEMGEIGRLCEARGIPVRALRMSRACPNPWLVVRLARWLRASGPRIVQTWMYHADLAGGLAARLSQVGKVVWGIHHSSLRKGEDRSRTIWAARVCARLSRTLPSGIICCSQSAWRTHADLGYVCENAEVIPNGVDLSVFRPDSEARAQVRRELRIPPGAPVIGIAARFHIHKDHRTFIEAAAELRSRFPEAYFVMCGAGMDWKNSTLVGWLRINGIGARTRLLGPRHDMPRLFAAMDIVASSSRSEALPMAIGEAMACGVPCAVTDVGDSALLVGETGMVVPSQHPELLARAWEQLLSAGDDARRRRGADARCRIESLFSLPVAIQRYQSLYLRLIGCTAGV
jgi:glycosyltransferase involved in cell wall biosynthesis